MESSISLSSSNDNSCSSLKKSSSSNSNKIREIVRLQQILKKWKKIANSHSKISNNNPTSGGGGGGSSKSNINKFLKKTLSFTEISSSSSSNGDFNNNDNNGVNPAAQPKKGYLAVCVGEELKRFVIPMEYLSHHSFKILLREAEEEFGFQQEGVLKIPCQVPVFENILKMLHTSNPNNPNTKKIKKSNIDDEEHEHEQEQEQDYYNYVWFMNHQEEDRINSNGGESGGYGCSSPDNSDHLHQLTPSHHHHHHHPPQLCR